jgi:hypothetical protein
MVRLDGVPFQELVVLVECRVFLLCTEFVCFELPLSHCSPEEQAKHPAQTLNINWKRYTTTEFVYGSVGQQMCLKHNNPDEISETTTQL